MELSLLPFSGGKNEVSAVNVKDREMGARSKVVEMRKSNPCASLGQIGRKLGITRERVRQILTSEKLPTRHITLHYVCNQCGKVMTKGQKIFCSIECFRAFHHITLICDECGKPFSRLMSDAVNQFKQGNKENKKLFCSKKCQGLWLAHNYGFGMFPQHGVRLSKKGLDR